ncbi:MAG: SDR family NAD(P)-dependent oxidoreductase [Candidatus Helarchaeota archaeon]
MELKDKIAILVGLNDVGIAVAKGLINEGAALVAGDTDQGRIDIITDHAKTVNGKAIGIICDATKDDQVKAMIQKTQEEFERIDILVTNFWESKSVPFVDVTEDFFDEVLDKNLKSVFRCIRAVIPTMRKAKYGQIIHIVPLFGYTGSTYNEVPLSTAAASLMGLTRAVAREIGRRKIRVNAVAIPPIKSESFFKMYSEESMKKNKELISLGKLCKPEDVVGPVVFLASERSSYVTGEIMIVSGGSYMQ